MKKLNIVLASLLIGVSFTALAEESEYNVDSRVLTIPTVKVGSGFVYDAQLRLNDAGSFDLIGFSENPPVENLDAECTSDKITIDIFNQIADGMTLEQVNSIIGCRGELQLITQGINGDRSVYTWNGDNRFPEISLQLENNIVVARGFTP